MATDEFKEVCRRPYADQAKFFLNAYWPEHGNDAEICWNYVNKMVQLDTANGKTGSSLDEFWSHKFLEDFAKTTTIVDFREKVRRLHTERPFRMSLLEYLVINYNVTVPALMARPQGINEELIKAQRALDDVSNEIARIEARKNELQAAADAPGVKAMQARNELAQLLTADQTDLNRRILTAEAAVRKAQRMEGVAAQGTLWWMERELAEAKKYKPQRRQ
eukprot:TRINITY_DN1475_c0_g1_i1.p1 TRINITY_DN1475_c0_g1~~TRINITY_DN1475_c0_g1_i1.p1  ORF type:complete len:220 (+),score=117.75 TRINITY_DN1475_c0_g1_i1:186-845(+)